MSNVRDAEIRIKKEMEKLIQLSEYVTKKDKETQEKLQTAENLFNELRKLEDSIRCDKENLERQRQGLCRDRIILAQERVSLLKEKSKSREVVMATDFKNRGSGSWTSKHVSSILCESDTSNTKMIEDLNLLQPVLRQSLASTKVDLNKLRQG